MRGPGLEPWKKEIIMARIAANVTELIGHTPLVRFNRVSAGLPGTVVAKLESQNPASSVKDRIGFAMIDAAEKAGKISPGKTILIEPTSGNTGIALAFVAAVKGYKLILTMPETMSLERRVTLLAYGAEIVLTPGPNGMKGAIAKANEILEKTPNGFILQQFDNPANTDYHYETTAREIFEQMDGHVDAITVGCGTAGTFSGVARFLKERLAKVHAVAVETQGSILGGGEPGPHKVEGIGNSFIPGNFDPSVCDEVMMVTDEQAFGMVKEMAAREGVLGGSSAGANVYAALKIARRLGAGKRVVTLIPDSAERYLSKKIFEGGI